MKIVTSLVIFLSAFISKAQAASQCWQRELNPYTNQGFVDQSAYSYLLQSWLEEEPEMPWITQLYSGWRVAKEASREAKTFKSDKRMHCYVGCRIAQETNRDVAAYAGWRKEYQDLTDCNVGTRFEYRDHEATLLGATIGEDTQGKNICLNSCPEN